MMRQCRYLQEPSRTKSNRHNPSISGDVTPSKDAEAARGTRGGRRRYAAGSRRHCGTGAIVRRIPASLGGVSVLGLGLVTTRLESAAREHG